MSEPRPARSEADPSDRELFVQARRGDSRARERLIERYLPMARRLARRYRRSEEPLEDLEQVASLGLVKAVDRYDPGRETAFSSFAVPTILGELKRHFRDRTWSVRVPRELQELALACEKAIASISADQGRAPTVAEIATAVHAGEEQVLDALQAASAYRVGSLDAPRVGAGEETRPETLGETIGAEEPGFARAEERATLEPALAFINERERQVLTLRFNEDLTQAEIGERIGVSQMQVSRLIRQALNRLREGLREVPSPEGIPPEGPPREDPPTG